MAFGASNDKPTIVKAGKATVTINGDVYLALNVQIQYQRSVEIVPTIGKERVISVGEPIGQISAEKVLGQGSLTALAESCKVGTASINVNDDCRMQGNLITCHNVILSAVTITAQGGRGYVATGVTGTFTAIDIK